MRGVPYASAVGSLMYAMICTSLYIAHTVGVVSRFLSNLGKEHQTAVKWILRYLRGTSTTCLYFGGDKLMLQVYTDVDISGDVNSKKYLSGYLLTFAGGAVSWQSRLRQCITLSTIKTEYIAITEGCKETLWIKNFLQELDVKQDNFIVYCVSNVIHLEKNLTYHSKSKDINVRYHWIQDLLQKKQLQVEKIHTTKNRSDVMIKSLSKEKLKSCMQKAGLVVPPT